MTEKFDRKKFLAMLPVVPLAFVRQASGEEEPARILEHIHVKQVARETRASQGCDETAAQEPR